MDTKKLFDKPMDELRAAFVRARFAQADVFGREDIETWLEQQRTAEFPALPTRDETQPEWTHFKPRGQNKTRGYGLDDYATPTLPQGQLDNDPFYDVDKYGKASLALPKFNAPLFLGISTAILQTDPTFQCSWATAFTIEWNGKSICLTEVDADRDKFTQAIQDVLFAEWLYHRPRWEKARKILCDSAEACILEQCIRAKADFDRAVAVSADGTQIVCADEVLVWSKKENDPYNFGDFISFKPTAFAQNKILLIERKTFVERARERISVPAPLSVKNTFSCINYTSSGKDPDNSQVVYKANNGRTYFVTHSKYCPAPLPQGGKSIGIG